MTIYVVMGTCGEYSDRREWPVVAFADEKEAQARVVAAETAARELYAKYGSDFAYWDIPKGSNVYDPKMQADYTGTKYFYMPVDLLLSAN